MIKSYAGFMNFGLRGLISLSKFLLTLVLASEFDLSVVGEYSVLFNAILIVTFLIGFDVYQYTSRTIINAESDRQESLIEHFSYVFNAYILIAPMFFLFFITGMIKQEFLLQLYFLLFVELLSNEVYRLLIALKHSVFANILLFIRSSLWVYLFIAVVYVKGVNGSPIGNLIDLWLISALVSVAVPVMYFNMPVSIVRNWRKLKIFDFRLVFNKWRLSYKLFLSSFLLLLINTVDKFVVELMDNKENLGLYVLFFSLGSMIYTFVGAGVISVRYPDLVRKYNLDKLEFMKYRKKFMNELLIVSVLMAFISIGLFFGYTSYQSEDVEKYTFVMSNINVYLIMLLSFFVYTVHMGYHYELFAAKNDRSIFAANGFMFLVYILLLLPLTYYYSIMGAAVAHLMSSCAVFWMKRSLVLNNVRINGY